MWFTETAWPPIIGLSVVAVLLLLAWIRQRQIGFLWAAIVCLVLCGVAWFVEQRIVTERERVEQRLVDLARTFQEESTQFSVANFAVAGPKPRSLEFVSASSPEVRLMVETALKLVDISDDIRLSDIHTTLTNNDSRAIMHLRASATVSVSGYGDVGRQPTRWELTWQREQGEWRVLRATRLHFLSGEPLRNPLATKE